MQDLGFVMGRRVSVFENTHARCDTREKDEGTDNTEESQFV